MEMEFKDNSRRRTLVLVIGVLLALGAGAAAFMLSSQSTEAPADTIPVDQIVVAAQPILARNPIEATWVTLREVPRDVSNADAFRTTDEVINKIAAIPILANQPITPNMLASDVAFGTVDILEPGEEVSLDSPVLRAVSLVVPAERAVGGLIAAGQRIDVIATLPFDVTIPVDPETGAPAVDPETNEPITYTSGSSTKPMWMDVPVIGRAEGSDTYILRMDLQAAEEVALTQSLGAQFTLVLRPAVDTREVDRSAYGETQDRLLTRYNFPIPELIDGLTYPQPAALPSPFPAEPYLLDQTAASPSPNPDDGLIEIPIDTELQSPAPEETE
jgi:Flp pilus assembly protein CpaB